MADKQEDSAETAKTDVEDNVETGVEDRAEPGEAETVRPENIGSSPMSEGGQHLESMSEISGSTEDESKKQGVDTVKDARKARLDRLRELHLRRVSKQCKIKS